MIWAAPIPPKGGAASPWSARLANCGLCHLLHLHHHSSWYENAKPLAAFLRPSNHQSVLVPQVSSSSGAEIESAPLLHQGNIQERNNEEKQGGGQTQQRRSVISSIPARKRVKLSFIPVVCKSVRLTVGHRRRGRTIYAISTCWYLSRALHDCLEA